MIKIENTVLPSELQWKRIIAGMRNPMNSWDKSDSRTCKEDGSFCIDCGHKGDFCVGTNDHDLMMKLSSAGTDHRKFMRMITVYCDITAPLYWWKEFDTYKVGTVANSCSTMHKIHEKEFTKEDFSCEHLSHNVVRADLYSPIGCLTETIDTLNHFRNHYLQYDDSHYKEIGLTKKDLWWQMIQLLPSSYNQKRTVMLNYEVLKNMYHSRNKHKLDEWRVFCQWIETLPYRNLITGK